MNPTQDRILALLAAAPGAVSGQELSRTLGITRAGVAKAIAGLRRLGYTIESAPRTGHRLLDRPDALLPAEVTAGLTTHRLGHEVRWYETVDSTQEVARDLAHAAAVPDGLLVVAEQQSAGRGRLGRAYASPPGGIWCTLVLRGPLSPRVAPYLSLAAGVAAARAIDATTGLATVLKWPNDVQVAGRKVTGILIEAMTEEQAIQQVLLGAGINVNCSLAELPPEIRERAATLAEACGHPVSRRALLQRYLAELEPLWDALLAGDGGPALEAWRAHRNILGQRVRAERWDDPVEGVAVALDDGGALIVETDAGERIAVGAGDVQALPEVVA